MATTEEELDQKRQRVQKLRDQVAQEEAKRIERENGLVSDVAAAQLDAEATRLEAQLAEAKRLNRVKVVKAGAVGVLEAVKADQTRAAAQMKAAEEAAEAAKDPNEAPDPEELEEEAVNKAGEQNAKETAPNATHVPEGLAESTTTTDTTKGV